ncbi:MAG TPA: sigma-70 family RNA polymerase sigma factor [Noviherbaspirillum sp.]|nr:sigma-70 family RNA polymerase sigma factor [Noviherbaspirillum sp.]
MINRSQDWSSAGYGLTFKSIRRLSEQEESHFVALAKTGDLPAREKLIVHHLPLLKMVARRYTERGLSFGELISEGMFGLVRAIERFDRDRQCRFGTYAKWWIRNAIEQALLDQGRLVRLPAHLARTRAEKRKNSGKNMGGAVPPYTLELVEWTLGEDTEEREQIAHGGELARMACDDTRLDGVEEATPETAFIHKQHLQLLRRALEQLTEREKEVIVRRFGLYNDNPETLESIAADFDISCEWTRKIQKSALAKLRSLLEPHYLGADR